MKKFKHYLGFFDKLPTACPCYGASHRRRATSESRAFGGCHMKNTIFTMHECADCLANRYCDNAWSKKSCKNATRVGEIGCCQLEALTEKVIIVRKGDCDSMRCLMNPSVWLAYSADVITVLKSDGTHYHTLVRHKSKSKPTVEVVV